MRIQKIQKNKLFLDSGEVVDVNREIILDYSLYEGMDIGNKVYEEVIYSAAISKAYFLLSRRDYSRKELTMKLSMKFVRKDILKKVVEKLVKQGYVDDYSYAKTYIESKKYGRKRIEYELFQKGIGSDLVEEVYKEFYFDERLEIKKILTRIEKKDRNKKIAYLARRGFEFEDIISELEKHEKGL